MKHELATDVGYRPVLVSGILADDRKDIMTFEQDYFGVRADTFDGQIVRLAKSFINDPYKAPEQRQQAQDYLDRYKEYMTGRL